MQLTVDRATQRLTRARTPRKPKTVYVPPPPRIYAGVNLWNGATKEYEALVLVKENTLGAYLIAPGSSANLPGEWFSAARFTRNSERYVVDRHGKFININAVSKGGNDE